jgi:hypothetical protein
MVQIAELPGSFSPVKILATLWPVESSSVMCQNYKDFRFFDARRSFA